MSLRILRSPASSVIALLCLLVPLLGCPAVEETPREGTDIVIQNAGTESLGRILVNGVDQGSLAPSGVLTLDDVGPGEFVIQVFRGPTDATPCAEYRTGAVRKGETAHHSFDCTRP